MARTLSDCIADVRTLLASARAQVGEADARLADPDPAWQAAATIVVREALGGLAAVLWARGWQPADLLRLERKDETSWDLAAAVLADQARSYRDKPGADPE